MIKTKERELKQIYAMVVIVFLVFLLIPIVLLLGKSFEGGGSVSLEHYADVAGGKGFAAAFGRSIFVSCVSAVLTTALAFVLAYTIHYTNVPGGLKNSYAWRQWYPCFFPPLHTDLPLSIPLAGRGLSQE